MVLQHHLLQTLRETHFLLIWCKGFVLVFCFSIRSLNKVTILFQLLLAAFVLFSFVLVIGVPVAWNQTKPLLFLGSLIWLAFVIVIGILNAFVA
jgi:photosystem II PsbZ protein